MAILGNFINKNILNLDNQIIFLMIGLKVYKINHFLYSLSESIDLDLVLLFELIVSSSRSSSLKAGKDVAFDKTVFKLEPP